MITAFRWAATNIYLKVSFIVRSSVTIKRERERERESEQKQQQQKTFFREWRA